jgi:hypothetical protein
MLANVLSSIGIVSVALWAVLVALEVVKEFRGEKFEDSTWEKQHQPSSQWAKYERLRLSGMKYGLGLILFGSTLQLAAIWV